MATLEYKIDKSKINDNNERSSAMVLYIIYNKVNSDL